MKTKYGNSFDGAASEEYELSVVSPWVRVDELMPKGVWIKAGSGEEAEGKLIKAGTPVYMSSGGTATITGGASAKYMGRSYEDAVVGKQGCALDVVLSGTLDFELYNGTDAGLNEADHSTYAPNIHFINQKG